VAVRSVHLLRPRVSGVAMLREFFDGSSENVDILFCL